MNGVSSVRIFLRGLESPPQVLNLNQGVARCRRRGFRRPIPTHHSWSVAALEHQFLNPLCPALSFFGYSQFPFKVYSNFVSSAKIQKMAIRKIIGTAFSVVAFITLGIFISRTEFSIQLHSWISLKYYMQFSPYVVSIMLLYCGVYLLRRNPKANFAMAIFGYTIFEITALDWMGIVSNNLGTYTTIMFVCCAIMALWIAHANSFSLRKLSLMQILISVFIGALESLLLYYLQFN